MGLRGKGGDGLGRRTGALPLDDVRLAERAADVEGVAFGGGAQGDLRDAQCLKCRIVVSPVFRVNLMGSTLTIGMYILCLIHGLRWLI